MPLNRIACPECGAGLKSTAGFRLGQKVSCPKCETDFEVEEPATADESDEPKAKLAKTTPAGKKPVKAAVMDDDDDFEPKKKKKKRRDDDDERSYKNSPIRYAILGVLLITMGVLGYLLYDKKNREAGDTADSGKPSDGPRPEIPPPPPLVGGPGMPGQGGPGRQKAGGQPAGFPGGIPGKFPPPKKDITPPQPGGIFGVGGATSLSPQQTAALTTKLKTQLVGTWKADLGDGKTDEIEYRADGTFTETFTVNGETKTTTGTWTVGMLVSGNRGLQISRSTGGTVKAIFEGEELVQETPEKGINGVFRKK